MDEPQHPRDSCFFCESEEDIEAHHLNPQRFGGSDEKSNLVDVCHSCHMKLERLYDSSFFQASIQSRIRQTVIYFACSFIVETAPEYPTKDDIFFTAKDGFYQLGLIYTRDQFETDIDSLLDQGCIYRVTDERFGVARPEGDLETTGSEEADSDE